MNIPAPIIFALLLLALIGFLWFLGRLSRRRVTPAFSPSNDLEHLLVASVGATEITPEMRQQLRSAVLFALESPEAPGEPMTLSTTFPSECADSLEDHTLTDDGKILFGPYVVCFSSRGVVDAVAADPVMGFLVTQLGTVREFSARKIFQSAIDQELDVTLNPFYGVGRNFTPDELQQILQSD